MIDWKTVPLGEVCNLVSGQSPKGEFYNREAKGLPFYQGKKEFTERILGSPEKWTTQVTKEAVAGDIVMSVRAPVGPVNEVRQRICIGRGLVAIRPQKEVLKDFLWYFLLSIQGDIAVKDGAVFPSINKSDIALIQTPLPSLKEQQRIVAILNEAFAKLETARANAEANLENAKELFQSVLSDHLGGAEEKSWIVKQLGEVCRIELGSTPARKSLKNWDTKKQADNIWLSIADLPSGSDPLVYDSKEYVSAEAAAGMKVVPKGTLMVSFKLTLGRVAVAGNELRTNEAIASILDLDLSVCNRDYLLWYFRAYDWNKAAEGHEKVKGKTLNKAKLRALPIVLPPIEDQQRIVEKLGSFLVQTDRLTQHYRAQLGDFDDLHQSLLQKAFAGELT